MDIVTPEILETRLAALAVTAPGECEGVFGPRSMRWRIDREAALFFGAGRALLLQLAHPWVAVAVAQHSRALDDPIGRFHGTFGIVFAMVFGRLDEAFAAARALHRRHAGISGYLGEAVTTDPAAPAYMANDRAALHWVHATLVETALEAYALVRPLTRAERDGYYAESRRFAGFFGLGPADVPADYPAFSAYCEAMLRGGTLAVGPQAREIATRLLAGGNRRVPVLAWYRALTASLLPAPLVEAYGLPFGARERRLARHVVNLARHIYPRLPERLRFVGPYHEARERLRGRHPSRLTRIANRCWIGRPSLGDRGSPREAHHGPSAR
jgi:uncharacterized protein (DUF2236 family)